MGKHTAYLLCGSNLGDRRKFLQAAASAVNEKLGRVNSSSSLYETEPWGFDSKHPFLNQALMLETELAPMELLNGLLSIERVMGRSRTSSNVSDRVIDIDILFYDSLVLDVPDLIIPHPRLKARKFALVPMVEIAADFLHPLDGHSMQFLLDSCKDLSLVRRIGEVEYE